MFPLLHLSVGDAVISHGCHYYVAGLGRAAYSLALYISLTPFCAFASLRVCGRRPLRYPTVSYVPIADIGFTRFCTCGHLLAHRSASTPAVPVPFALALLCLRSFCVPP